MPTTPETTTVPAWFNADAFEIPEAAVSDLRSTIAEFRALVPEMQRLTTRAKTALEALHEAHDARIARMGYLPDDVHAALSEHTGESELHDVLYVLAWYAEEITEGGGMGTEEYREKIRAKRGL